MALSNEGLDYIEVIGIIVGVMLFMIGIGKDDVHSSLFGLWIVTMILISFMILKLRDKIIKAIKDTQKTRGEKIK